MCLAPLLVLVVVFPLANSAFPNPAVIHDAYGYAMTAQRLVQRGYFAFSLEDPGADVPPNAVVTPGWPVVLAGVYAIEGTADASAVEAVRDVQGLQRFVGLLFSLGIVGAAILSGRHLGGEPLGLLAGLMSAFYLPFSWAATVSLSEHLGALLLAWSVYVALRLTASDAPRRVLHVAGLGALLGALFLVRPNLLFWMPVPFVYVAVRRLESGRRLVLLLAAGLAGFALVMSPWWIRNAVTLGMWVPVKTDTIPGAEGRPSTIAGLNAESLPFAEGAWVPTSPLQGVRIAARPWIPYGDVLFENTYHYDKLRVDLPAGPQGPGFVTAGAVPYATVVHLVIVALLLASLAFVRRSPRVLLLASVPVAVILVHGSHLNTRYLYPTMPAVVLAAAVALYGMYRWARKRVQPAS